MASLSIQLDAVALREATSQAIMGILTPELRAQMLSNAISTLLNPSTNSWDRGKSPIEQAFEQAVHQVAREQCLKTVRESPEIVAKLAELAKETANKVLNMNQEKLIERMADAFISAIKRND